MIALEERTLTLAGERVTLPVTVNPPVQKGSLDVWLSASRGGPPARGALVRQLRIDRGVVAPCAFFTRDVVATWPRNAKAWCVVGYAGQIIATGPVSIIR